MHPRRNWGSFIVLRKKSRVLLTPKPLLLNGLRSLNGLVVTGGLRPNVDWDWVSHPSSSSSSSEEPN